MLMFFAWDIVVGPICHFLTQLLCSLEWFDFRQKEHDKQKTFENMKTVQLYFNFFN